MRYGLIGCGRISFNHLKAAINNNLELVALCDIDVQAIETLLKRSNILFNSKIKKYNDYEKMINENKFDLISIATDSGIHSEIACYCLEHGIHTIIEKPIAMSIEDANKIISLSKKNDLKVSVCHQNRFNLAVQEMRKAVEQGRFGKLSHGSINIRWNRGEKYYKQASWRGKWASDGGTLMNQCIHGIDLLRWMMGDDIKEIYGITRQRFHNYIEAEDIGIAVIKFMNGAVGTIEGTVNVYPTNLEETLYLFGEKGTVKLGGKSTNSIDVWDFENSLESDKDKLNLSEPTSNVYGNGHTSLFFDMIDSIKNNRDPYVDAIAGKNALEVVLAIYKSQKINLPIKFPLRNFSSIEMHGEFNK